MSHFSVENLLERREPLHGNLCVDNPEKGFYNKVGCEEKRGWTRHKEKGSLAENPLAANPGDTSEPFRESGTYLLTLQRKAKMPLVA